MYPKQLRGPLKTTPNPKPRGRTLPPVPAPLSETHIAPETIGFTLYGFVTAANSPMHPNCCLATGAQRLYQWNSREPGELHPLQLPGGLGEGVTATSQLLGPFDISATDFCWCDRS